MHAHNLCAWYWRRGYELHRLLLITGWLEEGGDKPKWEVCATAPALLVLAVFPIPPNPSPALLCLTLPPPYWLLFWHNCTSSGLTSLPSLSNASASDAAKLESLLVKRVFATPHWCCSFCSPVVAVPSLAVPFFNRPARPTRCTCASKFFAASKFTTTITSDISSPQAATLVAIIITLSFFLNLEIAELRLCWTFLRWIDTIVGSPLPSWAQLTSTILQRLSTFGPSRYEDQKLSQQW